MPGTVLTLRGCSFPVGSTHPVPKEQTPVQSLLSLPHLTWPLHVTRSVLFPATLPPATLNPFYSSPPAQLPATPTCTPGSFPQLLNNPSLQFRWLLITLASGPLWPRLSSESGHPSLAAALGSGPSAHRVPLVVQTPGTLPVMMSLGAVLSPPSRPFLGLDSGPEALSPLFSWLTAAHLPSGKHSPTPGQGCGSSGLVQPWQVPATALTIHPPL